MVTNINIKSFINTKHMPPPQNNLALSHPNVMRLVKYSLFYSSSLLLKILSAASDADFLKSEKWTLQL